MSTQFQLGNMVSFPHVITTQIELKINTAQFLNSVTHTS